MRHQPPPHGHPLRLADPPEPPGWSTRRDLPTSPIVDTYTDEELRDLLTARGLSPFMVGLLVHDRATAGGRWRITQELAS